MYQVSEVKNPKARQIITALLKDKNFNNERMKSVSALLDNARQNQQEVLNELRSKVPHLDSQALAENSRINFIDLRIDDAIVMLEAVKVAPRMTTNLLVKMREFAVQASNAARSTAERKNLDMSFQMYKEVIDNSQMIGLIAGLKRIGGGDIRISFGTGSKQSEFLNIELPAIDGQSLGLKPLNILSTSSAQDAVKVIDNALDTLARYSVSVSEPVINDAEALLLYVPYMLYQNFNLEIAARDLMIKSLNAIFSNNERQLFNLELNYLKAAMQKNQVYVSLAGPVNTGGGNITIQVGKVPSPESMLVIEFPVTDIHLLGIDKFDITSPATANDAFIKMITIMKNFVYYPKVDLA